MGRADLIGPGKHQLVPSWQPKGTGEGGEGRRIAPKSHLHKRKDGSSHTFTTKGVFGGKRK
jgi:hypothetical protein